MPCWRSSTRSEDSWGGGVGIRMRSSGTFLAILALSLLCGCAIQVTPPAGVEEPATVFMLDHGRHTSLVVSTPEGGLVRYAYGDWRYYAERLTGPGHAIAALLVSTPGALGRRNLPGPPSPEAVHRQVPVVIDHLYPLQVERARVEALRRRLDAIVATAERELESPDADLVFVPHPSDYNLVHNSNRAIADWLVELGCEVRGRPLLARWRID
jgi:hypothetical protein